MWKPKNYIFSFFVLLIALENISPIEKNFMKVSIMNSTSINSKKTENKNVIETVNLQAYCFGNLDGIVYDLSSLYDPTSDYFFNNKTSYYYFNFCKFGVTKCKKDNAFIIHANSTSITNNTATDCNLLSGTNYQHAPQWKVVRNVNEKDDMIYITLPDGDRCTTDSSKKYYQTNLEIGCDRDISRLAIDNPQEIDFNKCENTLKMRSQFACPNSSMYSLANTVKANSVIFGLAIMALGIYFCFFSYKYVQKTRLLTGVIVVLFISIFVICNNLNVKFNTGNFYLVVILSVLVGLFAGWVLQKQPWLVASVLGGLLGFVFSELLFQAIAASLTWNPKAVYYIIFSISISIGAVLGGIFQKHVFIVACAFLGAYGIVRGFGTLENNFPNEQQLFELIEKSEWPQVNAMLDYIFYLYLLFSFIIGICGVCFQYKNYFKDIKDDNAEWTKME